MKSSIKYAIAAFVIAAAAIIGVVSLCRGAQTRTPVTVGVPEVSERVEEFCSALERGDMAAVEEMIYAYDSLGLTQQPESESAGLLLNCLRDSYKCVVDGENTADGIYAEQKLKVTYFSVWAAEEDVRANAQTIYDQRLAEAVSNEDLYDENGGLLESVALDIYDQAIAELVTDTEKYIVTEDVTLDMIYSDGSWQIILSDQLVNILLGGINRH